MFCYLVYMAGNIACHIFMEGSESQYLPCRAEKKGFVNIKYNLDLVIITMSL